MDGTGRHRKALGLDFKGKKAYYTNKNMTVQPGTGKHQEEREVLAKY
jgi:hypothetical protein